MANRQWNPKGARLDMSRDRLALMAQGYIGDMRLAAAKDDVDSFNNAHTSYEAVARMMGFPASNSYDRTARSLVTKMARRNPGVCRA